MQTAYHLLALRGQEPDRTHSALVGTVLADSALRVPSAIAEQARSCAGVCIGRVPIEYDSASDTLHVLVPLLTARTVPSHAPWTNDPWRTRLAQAMERVPLWHLVQQWHDVQSRYAWALHALHRRRGTRPVCRHLSFHHHRHVFELRTGGERLFLTVSTPSASTNDAAVALHWLGAGFPFLPPVVLADKEARVLVTGHCRHLDAPLSREEIGELIRALERCGGATRLKGQVPCLSIAAAITSVRRTIASALHGLDPARRRECAELLDLVLAPLQCGWDDAPDERGAVLVPLDWAAENFCRTPDAFAVIDYEHVVAAHPSMLWALLIGLGQARVSYDEFLRCTRSNRKGRAPCTHGMSSAGEAHGLAMVFVVKLWLWSTTLADYRYCQNAGDLVWRGLQRAAGELRRLNLAADVPAAGSA